MNEAYAIVNSCSIMHKTMQNRTQCAVIGCLQIPSCRSEDRQKKELVITHTHTHTHTYTHTRDLCIKIHLDLFKHDNHPVQIFVFTLVSYTRGTMTMCSPGLAMLAKIWSSWSLMYFCSLTSNMPNVHMQVYTR